MFRSFGFITCSMGFFQQWKIDETQLRNSSVEGGLGNGPLTKRRIKSQAAETKVKEAVART